MARGKYRNARDRDLDGDPEGEDWDDAVEVAGDDWGDAGTVDADDEVGADVADEADDAPQLTTRQRLAMAIAPKPPAPRAPRPSRPAPAARSARPTKGLPEGKTLEELMNGLEPRERMIALAAATLAVAFSIFVAFYYAHPPKGTKAEVNSAIVAAVIGGPALLFGGSVFIGRRALVGFMAILTGFAMLSLVGIVGFAYIGVGFWLIMKAQRYTRMAREASGEIAPRRPRAPRGSAAPTAKPTSTRSASGRSASSRTASTRTSNEPAKSKRYTPPRAATPSGRKRQTTTS